MIIASTNRVAHKRDRANRHYTKCGMCIGNPYSPRCRWRSVMLTPSMKVCSTCFDGLDAKEYMLRRDMNRIASRS